MRGAGGIRGSLDVRGKGWGDRDANARVSGELWRGKGGANGGGSLGGSRKILKSQVG